MNNSPQKVIFLATLTALGCVAYHRPGNSSDNEVANIDLGHGQALSRPNTPLPPPPYNEPPFHQSPPGYVVPSGSQSQV